MGKIQQSKILVIGSSNTDMVIKTNHLPRAGETVIGGTFFMNPGGKGANQAVAIARLGGSVSFICKTGNDIFGHQSKQLFEKEGIDTSYIFSDDENPSGVALITVDDKAENCIVVASGANANLLPEDLILVTEAINEADIVLMQLEIPMDTVVYVADMAFKAGKKVILNPAPAQPLSSSLLQNLYMITPNETEAEMITGVKITDNASAAEAARAIAAMGVQYVIITLGAKGALFYAKESGNIALIPSLKVDAVDTTAAGDIFNGALAVALSESNTDMYNINGEKIIDIKAIITDAVHFACKVAAISVTRLGAQSSAPYRNEVDIFCESKTK